MIFIVVVRFLPVQNPVYQDDHGVDETEMLCETLNVIQCVQL